jgi:hypothetical protein
MHDGIDDEDDNRIGEVGGSLSEQKACTVCEFDILRGVEARDSRITPLLR